MMKKVLLSLAAAAVFSVAIAQTEKLGNPVSWTGKLTDDVQLVKAPLFDISEQLMYDSINRATAKHLANRFGYEHEMDLDVHSSGSWFTTPKGDHIWRLELKSVGALSLNIIFDKFNLPEGSRLDFYAKDHTSFVGSYTAANNNEQKMLGTELIMSDHGVLELLVPEGKKEEVELHVSTLVHGYKLISSIAADITKGLNTSGDCNYDVNCLAGDGTAWENQRNCVAMIVSGGGICTGSLVNNTANDGTPYFITANHCGPNSAGSWVYRFRWESPNPVCAQTSNSTNGPETYNINGGILRASHSNADFGLIELNSAPDPSWNIYYNGWDNSDNTAGITSVYGIHHPDGDIKKICVENDAPTQIAMNFNGDPNTRMWRIADWDQGVTEPGSSGSPLFAPNGKTIGVLSGGYAACSGTNDNNQEDWYGRFGIAWDENAPTNQQLKHWLDPSNSGVTEIDGYDPNGGGSTLALDAGITSISSPSGTMCASSIEPVVTLRNYGTTTLTSITISYTVDGGTAQNYSWSGSLAQGNSEQVTLPSSSITSGNHTIIISCASPNGGTDENTNNDSANTSFNAVVGGVAVNLALQLDIYGSETTWEIRDDMGTVLYSGGPYSDFSADLIEEQFCLATDECYDFVLMDSYGDGMQGGFGTDPGTYTITDGSGSQLATMIAVDGDFGNEETNNFCVTVGIEENLLYEALNVYPNPSKDVLNIDVALNQYYEVSLIDQSGRVINSLIKTGNSKTQLDISALSSGVYFVKLKADSGVITEKLIVQ